MPVVHGQFFRAERGVSGGSVEREELRVRTVFSLRFGHIRTDDGEHVSQDAVRAAFNSPFRPFVLASTSIGQERLDFHPWCHRLIHWNLPGNPVDLEQREGRIHRYKGHAVRRNVAASHADDAFASWRAGKDIWALMFERADKPLGTAGGAPCATTAVHDGDRSVRSAEVSARGLPGGLRAASAGRTGDAAGSSWRRCCAAQGLGGRSLAPGSPALVGATEFALNRCKLLYERRLVGCAAMLLPGLSSLSWSAPRTVFV